MTETRAVLVARVSKAKQASDERYSIPAQLKAMRDYCEANGISIVAEFVEPGTSAFTADITMIPGLDQGVRLIESGRANALLVHESSRLARSERLTGEVADRLEAVGGKFINVSMAGLDYGTPEGRMILAQEASMNAYWSRKTGQHSKKGKQQQFESGLPVGAIPFGYLPATVTGEDGLPRTTRKLPPVIVPHEAEAIRSAFEDYILGKSPNQIAREWNQKGLVPRSVIGLTYFQPMTVNCILRNPFFAGEVVHLGLRRHGLHTPVIDRETFEKAQRPRGRIVKKQNPPALLRGCLRCSQCGHPLYAVHIKNSAKRPDLMHHYYREPSKDFNRPCPHAGSLWRMDELDPLVDDLVRTLAMEQRWLAYIDREARDIPDDAHGRRDALQEAFARGQREYLQGRLAEKEWDRLADELNSEIADIPSSPERLRAPLARVSSFAELWDTSGAETKNEACRLMFEEVIADMKERTVTVKPWPEFAPLFGARAHYVLQTRPGRG